MTWPIGSHGPTRVGRASTIANLVKQVCRINASKDNCVLFHLSSNTHTIAGLYFANMSATESFFGLVDTVLDALILIEAARRNEISRVKSRQNIGPIRSGSCFLYEESESGIKRWTDKRSWSATRVNGFFLCSRECHIHPNNSKTVSGPDSITASENYFVKNGLIKKSFACKLVTGERYHLVSYYKIENSKSADTELLTPSKAPWFSHIRIPLGLYVSVEAKLDIRNVFGERVTQTNEFYNHPVTPQRLHHQQQPNHPGQNYSLPPSPSGMSPVHHGFHPPNSPHYPPPSPSTPGARHPQMAHSQEAQVYRRSSAPTLSVQVQQPPSPFMKHSARFDPYIRRHSIGVPASQYNIRPMDNRRILPAPSPHARQHQHPNILPKTPYPYHQAQPTPAQSPLSNYHIEHSNSHCHDKIKQEPLSPLPPSPINSPSVKPEEPDLPQDKAGPPCRRPLAINDGRRGSIDFLLN
ncbi:Gti1/Pac2 family-domain-containing protein [Paraphysoderma sedebokerense]|nr:Gti1/Pac2 family-domain-containing protein [Paraphysoderma sedebokerense]